MSANEFNNFHSSAATKSSGVEKFCDFERIEIKLSAGMLPQYLAGFIRPQIYRCSNRISPPSPQKWLLNRKTFKLITLRIRNIWHSGFFVLKYCCLTLFLPLLFLLVFRTAPSNVGCAMIMRFAGFAWKRVTFVTLSQVKCSHLRTYNSLRHKLKAPSELGANQPGQTITNFDMHSQTRTFPCNKSVRV